MTSADNLEVAAAYLRDAKRMVVFTGAGVSAESGIDTFRDVGGLWSEFPPETFATWPGLLRTLWRRPEQCARFLLKVIEPIAAAQPNAAHRAVAELESHRDVVVVTQNVDALHQEAGSTTVHEIHGSLLEIVTLKGRFVRLLSRRDLRQIATSLDVIDQGRGSLGRLVRVLRPMAGLSRLGLTRPRVVLFGEAMAEPDWSHAMEACRSCDVLVVIGTSGTVSPAAMLPVEARDAGARVITIDPDEPQLSDVWLKGRAAEVTPALVARAFNIRGQ